MAVHSPRWIECVGTNPYEVGLCHGRGAASQIQSSLSNYREFFFATTGLQWHDIKRTAEQYLPVIATSPHSNHLVEEMRGIADGSGVEFTDILALNVRSEIALAVSPERAVPLDGCSAFTLVSNRGGEKRRYLAQNWDWKGSQLPNISSAP